MQEPAANDRFETRPRSGNESPARSASPRTPFDQPLRSCGDVLQTFVPAVQEATFVIQRALGGGPGGFRAERMIRLAGKIHAEFRVALKMLELAQAKIMYETRRSAPRKSRKRISERSPDHACRQPHEPDPCHAAASETAPHTDRRETADLERTPVNRPAQAASPVAG